MTGYVAMVNSLTGTTTYVPENRVNEYLAFGFHKAGIEIEEIKFEKKEDKLTDTVEKFKKTVAKSKSAGKKKV
jgi:hypothetical protein